MGRLRDTLKQLLPAPMRRSLRDIHGDLVFRRAFKRFLRSPEACTQPGNRELADLVYGWGNSGWSARDEYLASCLHHALRSNGPILECGSGLSTVLVGAIAEQRGQPHWALEHMPQWANRVRRYLDRYRIESAVVSDAPLKSYGSFTWYDPPLASMPASFALVLCDGPPGSTQGGRYGLVPALADRLAPGCVILLDDAGRQQERDIAERWKSELGASLEMQGAVKPYAKMILPVP